MKRISLIYIVASILTLGCGDSSPMSPTAPTSPSPPSLSGMWSGTSGSTVLGETGTFELTLSQVGSMVTGTWSSTDSLGTTTGNADGNISGSSLSLILYRDDPTSCQGVVAATFTSMTISGSWMTINCTVSDSGAFNAIKN